MLSYALIHTDTGKPATAAWYDVPSLTSATWEALGELYDVLDASDRTSLVGRVMTAMGAPGATFAAAGEAELARWNLRLVPLTSELKALYVEGNSAWYFCNGCGGDVGDGSSRR